MSFNLGFICVYKNVIIVRGFLSVYDYLFAFLVLIIENSSIDADFFLFTKLTTLYRIQYILSY